MICCGFYNPGLVDGVAFPVVSYGQSKDARLGADRQEETHT